MKDIFIGYEVGDERNYKEALHKGESGFIWIMDLEGERNRKPILGSGR